MIERVQRRRIMKNVLVIPLIALIALVPCSLRASTDGCAVVWTRHHDGATYTSVGISATTQKLIAGTKGSPATVELISLSGSGEPDWVYPFPGHSWCVGAAKQADVFVGLDCNSPAQTVHVYKWHAASPVPDWTYSISGAEIEICPWCLSVSEDGSTVGVLVQTATDTASKLYAFDGTTGGLLFTDASPDGFAPLRVACNATGSYLLHSAMNEITGFGRIFALTRSGNRYWTGIILGGVAGLHISPDGDHIAHDAITLIPIGSELVIREWRDFPPGYPELCAYGLDDFYMGVFSTSWDFGALAGGWADTTGQAKVKLFNMPSCSPSWTYNFTSGFTDAPSAISLSSNGEFIAVGSATESQSINPEVLVFDRSNNTPICNADTLGDVNTIDIAEPSEGCFHVAAAAGHDLYVLVRYLCGDANGDCAVTPADGYMILNYLGAGPLPVSCWAANAAGGPDVTPADGYRVLNYLGTGPDLDCQPCEFPPAR
jgi:WD40 repeat protein